MWIGPANLNCYPSWTLVQGIPPPHVTHPAKKVSVSSVLCSPSPLTVYKITDKSGVSVMHAFRVEQHSFFNLLTSVTVYSRQQLPHMIVSENMCHGYWLIII